MLDDGVYVLSVKATMTAELDFGRVKGVERAEGEDRGGCYECLACFISGLEKHFGANQKSPIQKYSSVR